MSTQILITTEGYKKLRDEYEKIINDDIPRTVKRIEEARSLGDLKENAAYHEGREKQAMLQGRAEELEAVLKQAQLVDTDKTDSRVIIFGSVVELKVRENKRQIQIVSPHEADASTGKISGDSPLGMELMGKVVGDVITVNIPAGRMEYEVVSVK